MNVARRSYPVTFPFNALLRRGSCGRVASVDRYTAAVKLLFDPDNSQVDLLSLEVKVSRREWIHRFDHCPLSWLANAAFGFAKRATESLSGDRSLSFSCFYQPQCFVSPFSQVEFCFNVGLQA